MSRKRKACFAMVAIALGLLLLEGLASVAVVANKMRTQRRLAERLHTEYDAQLGWINKSDFQGRDLYGKSLHLHTNAQRFRATEPTSEQVPPGRVRVVCTGDSFTLGYGVADVTPGARSWSSAMPHYRQSTWGKADTASTRHTSGTSE